SKIVAADPAAAAGAPAARAVSGPAAPTGRKVSTRMWRRSVETNWVYMISTRSSSPARKRAIRSWVSARANSRLASAGNGVCAASARPWARRSFAAATISMALVICWVFSTERMRRRRTRSVLMGSGLEARLELLRGLVQPRLVGVRDRLLGAQVVRHLGVLPGHERQPLLLELAHRLDRQVVEVAVGARPDRDHLLLDRHGHELLLLEQLHHA